MFFKLTKYLIVPLMAVMAAGCSDTLDSPVVPGAGKVTLTFRNSEGTRSAESDASEVKIDNLVVALYPDAPGDDTPAVALQTFTGLNASVRTTVDMNLTDEMKAELFNNVSGASCKLYAVANVDDPAAVPADATIAQLKGITATSQFDTKKVQPSFVMAGSGSVTYRITDGIEAASGSAVLNRAAAKISLNIKLPEFVEDEAGVKWYPVTNAGSMRVLLKSGVKGSVACPADGWAPADESAYFDITNADTEVVRILSNKGGEYPYQTGVPFYTYPNAWEETPSEKHKTSMTLLVPWQKAGEQTYLTFYYQVPVTDMSKLLPNYSYTVNLNVGMLGSLSPETPEEVDELSYQIVNWGETDINADFKDNRYLVVSPTTYEVDNEETITIPFYTSHDAEISDITIEYKRYNYYSDGNGDVVSFTIDKTRIDRSISGTDTLCYSGTKTVIQNGREQQLIVIKHPLYVWTPYNSSGTEVKLTGRSRSDSDKPERVQSSIYRYTPTKTHAYSPYTIKFKIQHKDNANYNEVVTINQYPGMYIEAVRNKKGYYNIPSTNWSGYVTGVNNVDYGFVYVNPTKGTYRGDTYWKNDDNLGGLKGLTGKNKNPNMYIISITVISGDLKDYIISDPRINSCNNNLSGTGTLTTTAADANEAGTWCATANSLYSDTDNKNRKLKFYYPTDESDACKMMIAPKLRVASSYGVLGNVTTSIDRQAGRRRIATYQEQDCPAGRWRLPTYGELNYIVKLSSNGIIPLLFNKGATYLTAQGPYSINNDNTGITPSNDKTFFVRGVYDEWYWEEEKDYVMQRNDAGGYDYTLGDMPRELTKSATRIEKYKRMMKK